MDSSMKKKEIIQTFLMLLYYSTLMRAEAYDTSN